MLQLRHLLPDLLPSGLSSFVPDLVSSLKGFRHEVVCPKDAGVDMDVAGTIQFSGAQVLVGRQTPYHGITIGYGDFEEATHAYSYTDSKLTDKHGTSIHLPPAVTDTMCRLETFNRHNIDKPQIVISHITSHTLDIDWLDTYISRLPAGLNIASTIDVKYPHKTILCSPLKLRKQFLEAGIMIHLPRTEPVPYGRAVHEAIAMGLCVLAPRLPVLTSVFAEAPMFFDTPEEAASLTESLSKDSRARADLVRTQRRVVVGRCLRNHMAELETMLKGSRYAGKGLYLGTRTQEGPKRNGHLPAVLRGGADEDRPNSGGSDTPVRMDT